MRSTRIAAALWFAGLCLVASGAGTEARAQYSRRTPIVEAVQKTRESIVTVKVAKRGRGKETIGTGVIVDERGFIITNRHVIHQGERVVVRLADGSDVTARVLAADPRCDLAILRIRTSRELQALLLAPASDVMVGETVIAVGHPFGYRNTVSTGIISAVGREIEMPTGDVLSGLFQTDASINPGNSGGPLLHLSAVKVAGVKHGLACRENVLSEGKWI
jgi:S1-C subfamily serine protease